MAVYSGNTIEQLIGLPALLGLMNETTSGLPDPLPEEFEGGEGRKVVGNSARLFIGYGQRKTPKAVKYGAPSVNAGLEALASKDVILLSFFESQPIDPLTFQRLHDFDNYNMQQMGAGEVARQVGLFKEKYDNARKVAKWSCFRSGAIYLDSNGNLLPNSSGAAADWTLDFGVAAGHQTRLDYDGGGNIIADLWSDTTNANIPAHIENLQVASARESGLEVEHAMYGSLVPGYIRKNTFCQNFLQYDPGMYRTFNRSTTIPDGFLGLKWHPMQKAFFENSSEANVSMWDADKVTFTPAPKKGGWWEKIVGSQIVPNTIDIQNRTMTDIQSSAKQVFGQFAYSRYVADPVGLLNYMGDNFVYAIRNPKAVWIATID